MENQKAAQAFKALGDENRLKILQMVAEQDEICACDLLEAFDFTQPTLSHHIKILCAAGLIECRKEGKWMHYSLNPDCVKDMRALLSELLEKSANDDKNHLSNERCG